MHIPVRAIKSQVRVLGLKRVLEGCGEDGVGHPTVGVALFGPIVVFRLSSPREQLLYNTG